jgi:hypothetical protein
MINKYFNIPANLLVFIVLITQAVTAFADDNKPNIVLVLMDNNCCGEG